ncbi:MAG: hypothetical protein AAFY29_22895 [Pseudomonadota bacterium]
MNDAAIRDAQSENDAVCDAPEPTVPTSYELALKLSDEQFEADQGDYLICPKQGQARDLLEKLQALLLAESKGDRVAFNGIARDIGHMIGANFTANLNELHGEDRL